MVTVSLPGDQTVLFSSLDLYRHSPESGDLWYTSRRLKKTICFPSQGWWKDAHAIVTVSLPGDQTIFFSSLDLYRHSPEFGDLLCTSRQLKKKICSPSQGWWNTAHAIITVSLPGDQIVFFSSLDLY